MPSDAGRIVGFLEDVWGSGIDAATGLLWTLPKKASIWTTSLLEAAQRALQESDENDVYFGVALCPLTAMRKGRWMRCDAAETVSLKALWLDVDIAGPPHRTEGLPPSKAAAEEVLFGYGPMRPTLVVDSGYGLQAYWILREAVPLEGQQRRRVAQMCQAHHYLWAELFEREGWKLDALYDLARVLRVPGTWNRKIADSPRKVELYYADGPRYSLEQMEELVAGATVPGEQLARLIQIYEGSLAATEEETEAPGPVLVDIAAVEGGAEVVSPVKVALLFEADPIVEATFRHTRADLQGRSLSEYDQALATRAAFAGWKAREIRWLLEEHRREWKGKRHAESYYKKTIGKALAAAAAAGQGSVETAEEAAVSEEMTDGGVKEALSSRLGLTVERFVRRGVDPAEFYLWANGVEIRLGKADEVLRYEAVQAHVMARTSVVMPEMKKADWLRNLRMMFRLLEVVDLASRDRSTEALNWVRDYLERDPGGVPRKMRAWEDKEAWRRFAAQFAMEGPWWEEDAVGVQWAFVSVNGLMRFLRSLEAASTSVGDVQLRLSELGFESVGVTARLEDGRRITRRWWRIRRDLVVFEAPVETAGEKEGVDVA